MRSGSGPYCTHCAPVIALDGEAADGFASALALVEAAPRHVAEICSRLACAMPLFSRSGRKRPLASLWISRNCFWLIGPDLLLVAAGR